MILVLVVVGRNIRNVVGEDEMSKELSEWLGFDSEEECKKSMEEFVIELNREYIKKEEFFKGQRFESIYQQLYIELKSGRQKIIVAHDEYVDGKTILFGNVCAKEFGYFFDVVTHIHKSDFKTKIEHFPTKFVIYRDIKFEITYGQGSFCRCELK